MLCEQSMDAYALEEHNIGMISEQIKELKKTSECVTCVKNVNCYKDSE